MYSRNFNACSIVIIIKNKYSLSTQENMYVSGRFIYPHAGLRNIQEPTGDQGCFNWVICLHQPQYLWSGMFYCVVCLHQPRTSRASTGASDTDRSPALNYCIRHNVSFLYLHSQRCLIVPPLLLALPTLAFLAYSRILTST